MGVFKPLGERRRLLIFQLGESRYLLFGEDESVEAAMSISVRSAAKHQETEPCHEDDGWESAGKVLRLSVVCTLSPPNNRGSPLWRSMARKHHRFAVL